MEHSKINLVIIDDNKEFCNILRDYLSLEKDINILGIANDGVQALRLMKEVQPDLIILDIIMPHLDGIGVLESLSTMNLSPQPKVMILSAVGQDHITQRALTLGADYYIVKPFDMSMFVDRIKELSCEGKNWDEIHEMPSRAKKIEVIDTGTANTAGVEEQITDAIHRIGIPANIKGYMFVREAINMAVNNMTILSSMTKVVYPTIAEKFHTTPSRVERAIRHAIEVACSRGQSEALNEIFGNAINSGKGKPTNSEFIALISDRIRLKNRAS